MRGYFGWLGYRDAVLADLNALLVAYPRGRQFTDDFPGLKSLLRSHFDGEVHGPSSALQISETIIGTFIRQLSEAQRTNVLEALIANGRKSFEEFVDGQIAGRRGTSREPVAFSVHLTGCALFIADRMASRGLLGRSDTDAFVERIAKTLGADEAKLTALRASLAP